MEIYKTFANKNGAQIILQTIKDYGPISKREIQEKTNLSWGHVSQVTKHFLDAGYIVVSEKEMTAGRARELLDINKDDNYFVGVDISCQRMRVVLTDMKGRVIEGMRKEWEQCNYRTVLNTIYEVLDDLIFRYSDKKICGVGFAVQGIVDASNGISVRIDKIRDWRNVPLKDLIENRYGVETVVAHDPDCIMKCENCLGLLKHKDVMNAILIHYGYGFAIGMSIMINGQIYVGYNGTAGEIGYTLLDIGADGKQKMLEHYVDKRDTDIDIQTIIHYIGCSIATVNSLFSPEIIILHLAEADYQENIVRVVGEYLQNYSYNKEVQLRVSHLSQNAKALGAALMLADWEIARIVQCPS